MPSTTKYYLSYSVNEHLMPTFSFGSKIHTKERANFLKLKRSSRTALLVDGISYNTDANAFTAGSMGLGCMTVGNAAYKLDPRHMLGANFIYADLHAEFHKLPAAPGAVIPETIVHRIQPAGSQWIYAE